MKNKYKIGNLVMFAVGGVSDTGIIEAIVMREAGFFYQMKNHANEVKEEDIMNAYKPVISRPAKPRAPKAAKAVETKAPEAAKKPAA